MKRRRPPRTIIRVVVFLLLGAIVNVAVAWGIQHWSEIAYPETPALRIKSDEQPPVPPSDFPFEFAPIWRRAATGFGQEWRRYSDDESHAHLYVFVEEHRVGWPSRCLYGEWWVAHASPEPGVNGGAATRYLLGSPMLDEYSLSLLPLWPGFAINTLFYVGILWLLWITPFAIRRRRRIKRGCCGQCGYDLRGTDHSVCPECGQNCLASRVGGSPT